MELLSKSDEEIRSVAEPILMDIIKGTNSKDWALFSKHMPDKYATDPELKINVQEQWEESEWLTSLEETAEYLGVIRKAESVVVVFKQRSTKSTEDYLEKLSLIEVDGEVKQDAIWLD